VESFYKVSATGDMQERILHRKNFEMRSKALTFWTNKEAGGAFNSWRAFVLKFGVKAKEKARQLAELAEQRRELIRVRQAEEARTLKLEQAARRAHLKKTEDERMRAAFIKSVNERGKAVQQELQYVPHAIEEIRRVKGVSDTTLREIIRNGYVSTLKECSERGIQTLCRQVKFVLFPRNTRIMEQGGSGDTMLCLLEGECDVYVGGNRLFRMGVEMNKVHGALPYIANGAVLGEMAVLTGDRRSATVIAATKVCKMIEISRGVLKEVIPSEVWDQLETVALQRKQANEDFLRAQALLTKKRKNPLLLHRVKPPA